MRFYSIRSEISELDRCTRDLDLAVNSYRGTFSNVAESALFSYPAQLNPSSPADPSSSGSANQSAASGLTDRLRTLAESVSTSPPTRFPECTEQLREILRECGERTSAHIAHLENERASIEKALLELANTLEKSHVGSDNPIKSAIERLRTLALSAEGRSLKPFLQSTADSVERGVQQIQRQHCLSVANFQREIRSLHHHAYPLSIVPASLQSGTLLDRPAIETLLGQTSPARARIALLHLRGFRMLCNQPGSDAANQVLNSFVSRSQNTFPHHTSLGRWSHDEFVAVFPPPDAGISTMAFCRSVLEGLSDPYTCTVEGRTFRSLIEVSACVVDIRAHETPAQLLEKVETAFLRM